MSDFEAALRRAVGLDTAPAEEQDTPDTEPPALNSDQLLNTLTAKLGITTEGN